MKSAKASMNTESAEAAVSQFVNLADQAMSAGCSNAESMTKTHMEQLKEMQLRTAEQAGEQVKVFEEVGRAMVANTETVWNTMIGMVKTNTESNLSTMRRLFAAKDPSEWSTIGMDAMTEAATRFSEQAASLTQLASESSANVYGPVSRFVEKNVDKVAAKTK